MRSFLLLLLIATAAWAQTVTPGTGGGGSGTVSSVGFTGGIVSVGTPTTTPAFTVAGTSGGVPYFSSSSTWASSAALLINNFMLGGGAGAAPKDSGITAFPLSGGTFNVGIGTGSGGVATGTGSNNVCINASNLSCFYSLTTGSRNVVIGASSAYALTSGSDNYVIANGANTTGSGNVALGMLAGASVTTQDHNVSIGYAANQNNATSESVAIGYQALRANTSGALNLALGAQALLTNTTGNNNVAIGPDVLEFTTTGSDNTGFGQRAIQSNTTGAQNVAIGSSAGYTLTPANANVTGSDNTWLGFNVGPGDTTQYNFQTAIGANAVGNCSNCVVLGRPSDSVIPGILNLKGSVVAAGFGSATAQINAIGGNNQSGCNKTGYWPVAGYLRYATITTRGTNTGVNMRAGVDLDCASVNNVPAYIPTAGGAIVTPLATAGAFTDTAWQNAYHEIKGSLTGIGWYANFAASTAATVNAVAMEFIGDAATYPTILPAIPNTALTASTTGFSGLWTSSGVGFQVATELSSGLAAPFAGTVSGMTLCTGSNVPTNNETWTLRVNSASPASGPVITVVASDAANQCYVDSTHTATVNAGDYIDFQSVTGASTVSTISNYSIVLVPSTGTSTLIGGPIGVTVSTTANYYNPLVPTGGTATIANAEMGLPNAYTLSKFYVMQGTANGGGVTTTCTIYKNGVATAVTGTITSGSGTGALLLDGTHSVSFAQSDLLTMGCSTGSGTSGTMASWSAQLQ